MADLDPLLTIAEVSVAFAGFASLVTVVARRDIKSWNEGNLVRFRLMIYMSLSSILFALLPFAFLYFKLESETVWRYSGGLLGLYLGSYLSLSIPVFVKLVRSGELNGFVASTTASLGIVAAMVQILSFFYVFQPSVGTYFVGALYFLFLSGVSFVRLVAVSILPGDNSGDT
jgi:hypothetical protein